MDLQTIPECDLGFVEYNPTQPRSLVFIHGALSSPLEASLAAQYLDDFHILVPALHKTIAGKETKAPFSIPNICAQLAVLIEKKARAGRAHIYGHSMGAHIALNFAVAFPDHVLTVIASGVTLFSHWSWWQQASIPSLLYAQAVLVHKLPLQQRIQIFNAGMRPASETLAAKWMAEPGEGDWTTCKEICTTMNESLTRDNPLHIKAKTLVVAGTQRVGDTPEDVRWVVEEIRKTGGEASGIRIRDGGHPWILQLPELCSKVIRSWVEARDLPEGTVSII